MIFRAAYFAIFLHFLRITLGKLMVTPDETRAVCYDCGDGVIIVLGRARMGARSHGVMCVYSRDELVAMRKSSGRFVVSAETVLMEMVPPPRGLTMAKLRLLHKEICVKYNRQQWCTDFVRNVNEDDK